MGINFGHIWIVFRKELLDVLRDRRTILSMIVIPILIMPVLSGGIAWFTKHQITKLESQKALVQVIGADRFPNLIDELKKTENIQVIDTPIDTAQALKLLRDESVRVVVNIPKSWSAELASAHQLSNDSIQLFYLGAKEESSIASDRVREAIKRVRDQYTEELITQSGLSKTILKPFIIYSINSSTPTEVGGKIVGMFLPYMLILLSLTGAMYPAIDLTAGEKERGTLETLLLSPASRTELVLGKFFTVMLTSMTTAILSLASIAMMSKGMLISMPPEILDKLNLHIGISTIFTVVVLMIPLSAIFSSLLLAISLLAKSYKEAQSYISPLMILAIFPAMASIMPGVKTDLILSLIPVLNVSLLIKDSFAGNMNPMYLATAFLSTVVFAAISLRVCVVTFMKESVLFRV